MTGYQRIATYIKPYWVRLLWAMICMIMVAGLTSLMAFMVKPVMDEIFVDKRLDMLKLLPPAIFLLFLVKGAFTFGSTYLMNFVGQKIVADLRDTLYAHLQALSLSFFDRNQSGVLISRITNDVNLIQGAVSHAVTGLLKEVFTIVFLVGVIFYRDWKLASIAIIVFPIAIYPLNKFGKLIRRISRQTQVTMGEITSHLQETISGNRIVKAFATEEYETKRFNSNNLSLFKLIVREIRVRAISSPIMESLGGLGVAFIIGWGGYNVIKGYSTPGTFFSFITALVILYDPIRKLNGVNATIQTGLAAAARVFEVLDTVPEIRDREGARNLAPFSRSILFDHVYFGYDGSSVLKGIDLEVRAGEVLAIVGSSGGGKTTLVNLIPRFYDVVEGRIEMDGVDIRDVTVSSLRSQIGIVSQQTILFNDTVYNNIVYGSPDRTEAEAIRAAKQAYAYDFIQQLPKKFDTVIGDQGVRLSGGERQRLSIARALLKDAPILILDEATSSLDSESELEVQGALENLMKSRTTFVIAHRLSTVRNADRIIVLTGGRISEEGRHDELMIKKGEYYRLYQLQFQGKVTPLQPGDQRASKKAAV